MNNPFKTERYQGFKKKNAYFEGWYFKAVSADLKTSLALIPGVSLSKKDKHAFIQVFVYQNNGGEQKLKTFYFRFDYSLFKADKNEFKISIGDNNFSKDSVDFSLASEKFAISGYYKMKDPISIPKTLFSPSIMGPFAYLPRMECYHGIVSMNHTLSGSFSFENQTINLTNGKGYIEKDYGRSFPSEYVWVQANNFATTDTSLFLSVATIPYLGLKFDGYIVNFYQNKKHYRFATYNSSRIIKEIVDKRSVTYHFKKGKYQLEVSAEIDSFVTLASPKLGAMENTIKEGLSGQIYVKLTYQHNVVFEGTSTNTGIEIMKVHH